MTAKEDKKMIVTRPLSMREVRIFVLCLVLVIGYVSYQFVLQPTKESIIDLENKITVSEKRLRKNLGLSKQKAQIDANYSQYASLLKQNVSNEQQMALIID